MTFAKESLHLIVNGEPQLVPDGHCVLNLVADLLGREITPAGVAGDGQPLGVAVAHNESFVPRAQWATTRMLADDVIEIVTAVQGG